VLVVRFALRLAFAGYVKRIEHRRTPADIASLRTRYTIIQRLIVGILLVIVAWSVLEIFSTTRELGRSLLASGAILTLLIGLALSGPLSNLGAGILLGLTQPVRLGDRITIGDVTGTATEISLYHTVLITDDGRRVFVPNAQMTSTMVSNLSIDDLHRTVIVRFPVSLTAPVDRVREVLLEAARETGGSTHLEAKVVLDELTESSAWFVVSARVASASEKAELAGELRERGLKALAEAELLPAPVEPPRY
jgi:small-conductance mechanosensitive channel